MKPITSLFCVLGAATVLLSASAISGGTAATSLELPQSVRDAVSASFPGATIGGTGSKNITVRVFEVELDNGGTVVDAFVTEDGTVLATESEIDRVALPTAVAASLGQLAGTAKIDEIERTVEVAELRGVALGVPVVTYEAEWSANGKRHSVVLASDGTLVDDDGDDDDDDDDDD